MRKKTLGIIAVTLTASVLAATLTGCGTRAKATDQEVVMEEESIIVTDEEDSEKVTIETEDEITETEEVIADDGEESNDDVSYTEYEFFYVKDNLEKTSVKAMDMNDLKVEGKTYTLNESVNIYAPTTCILKGYTKPNIDVYVNSCNEDWYCLYFEDEASPNNYVLVKADDFIASSGVDNRDVPEFTYEEVKSAFWDELYKSDEYLDIDFDDTVSFSVQDEITDDMEYVEIKIAIEGFDINDLMKHAIMENRFYNYKTFVLEQIFGEPDDIVFLTYRVYYKDLQEFAP